MRADEPLLILDHVFVMSEVGAPVADRLVEAGFVEGSGNVHPGQGTANRRFFFHNGMLEFLWAFDPAEAQSELTRPTKLWERWQARADVGDEASSPFGVCARLGDGSIGKLPFPSWRYRPRYLPDGWRIDFAECESLSEPCWFVLTSPGADSRGGFQPVDEPLDHPLGLREITSVTLHTPSSEWSKGALAFQSGRVVKLSRGAHLMVVDFDHRQRDSSLDLRPESPLVLRW